MHRSLFSLVITLASAVCYSFEVSSQTTNQPAVSTVTFGEINHLFGVNGKLTDIQKDREWEKYRGLCVEWTGKLSYLDSKFFGGFSVGMKHLRGTLTYDVLIDAPSSTEDILMGWNMDEVYTYRATLTRYGGAILPISADWGCEEH